MMKGRADISVIVPTTCELRRATFIQRAVRSVLLQQRVLCELIIVVNGDKFDRKLLDSLKCDNRLKTLQIQEAHVSLARFHGVRESRSDYLCFLDDDDEFLAGALQFRVDVMRAKPDVDVLVTNGYCFCGADRLLVDANLASQIREDLAHSFLSVNWFASPASLFRSSSLEVDFFDLSHKYFEWTYLFFKLVAAGKRIEYSDAVTYRKFEDHGFSVSDSDAYYLAYPGFLLDLLKLPLDKRIRSALRHRYVTALSGVSNRYLSRREFRLAFVAFVKFLLNAGWTATPDLAKLVSSSRHRSPARQDPSASSPRLRRNKEANQKAPIQ
jgi:glycosyltransferase involved in cell wall biosynthesis